MKLGIFFLSSASPEIQIAADFIQRNALQSPFEKIKTFLRKDLSSHLDLSAKTFGKDPHSTVETVRGMLKYAVEQKLDRAWISFGNVIPTDLTQLHDLLSLKNSQEAALTLRYSGVNTTGTLLTGKAPFVDEHFLVFNLNKFMEHDIFSRPWIYNCHFASAGTVHAILASFFETAFKREELFNVYSAPASPPALDAYGRQRGFYPVPYSYCPVTGLMTCYLEIQPSLLKLVSANLGITSSKGWKVYRDPVTGKFFFRGWKSASLLKTWLYRAINPRLDSGTNYASKYKTWENAKR